MNWFGQSSKYPALTSFLNGGGRLELGYIYQMNVSVVALDESNVVWEGKSNYRSLEELLNDVEHALEKWEHDNT